jgi:hypothetical protein
MLDVMQDENADVSRRDDMARAAAPYIHARLQSTRIAEEEEPLIINIVEYSDVCHERNFDTDTTPS